MQKGTAESDDLQAVTAFGRSLLDLANSEHEHNLRETYALLARLSHVVDIYIAFLFMASKLFF